MKNELLTIGPFTIYGYGLMIAIGIVAGCLTAEYRARKQGLDSEQIFPMILWCLVGGFLCAKLLFWITEWKSIAQDPGYDGNLKFRFCGVRRNYRRDTDRIFVLQDQRSYIF